MKMWLLRYSLKALILFLIVGGGAFFFIRTTVVWAQDSVTTSSDEERYQENLRRWQSMPEEQRQAIRSRAAGMSEADRAVLQEKAKKYRAMSEQERQTLRENYRKFRELPPERREVLEERPRGFRQLPQEKRGEVRRRYQEQGNKTVGKRREPAAHKNITSSDVRPEKTLPDQKLHEKSRSIIEIFRIVKCVEKITAMIWIHLV